jgi:hypothetical protein
MDMRIGRNDSSAFREYRSGQVGSGRVSILWHVDYHKEDSQKEEWDERRAFGYDVTYNNVPRHSSITP